MYFDNDQNIKSRNENEKKRIKCEMAQYGYTEKKTDFFDTKSYEKLMIEFMKARKERINNYHLTPRTIDNIRKKANILLLDQIGSANKKVLFLEDDAKIIYDFTATHGQINDKTKEEFLKYIADNVKKVNVTKLPIKWLTSHDRNGFSRVFDYETDDLDFLKQAPIISTGLSMINQNDDIGTTVLVHEMTHALLDRNKGIIKNRLHDEMLSIYLELVSAYELDDSRKILEIATRHRLQYLKEDVIMFEKQKLNKEIPIGANYIDSCLYAFALFEQYRKASSNSRKSIRKEINKTIQGKRTLEDTLEKLDITEEEGSKVIRKKIKKIMK